LDPTLTPDVPSTESAVSAVLPSLMPILAYCEAVGKIQTGPQSFNSNGISGSVDPFATLPAFKTAVELAQTHAQYFAVSVFFALGNWGEQQVPEFSGTFYSNVETIFSTITAIGKATPNAAQRQTIQAAFATIVAGMTALHDSLTTVHANLLQFVQWMQSDYVTLTDGPNDMASAIAGIEAYITGEEEAAAGPFGSGLIGVLSQVETLMITPLQTVSGELTAAGDASAAATSSTSSLLDLVADLKGKYDAVNTFITNADDATLASNVQRIDLRAAQNAWQELSAFIPQVL
jgi:hypothetical protein